MKRRFTRKYAGMTVSEATLREEDLIPAFIETLKPLVPTVANKFKADWDSAQSDDAYTIEEAGSYILEDLFRELDARAPAGCYFGAHEVDGALFGFWEAEP